MGEDSGRRHADCRLGLADGVSFAEAEPSRMRKSTLDPRIAADTVPIVPLGLCELRLMNDARFPWLLLIPRVEATEIIDLSAEDRATLFAEITEVSAALR